MQEVEGWVVEGELDYTLLRGDTGPLVYPAGFMYLYAALRWITGGGRGRAAVAVAQWVFLGLYLAVLALVLRVYAAARPGPPWIVLLLALSKRVHSLFVLRLFNDCWAMLFAYAAVLAFMRHRVRAVRGGGGERRESARPPCAAPTPPVPPAPLSSGSSAARSTRWAWASR